MKNRGEKNMLTVAQAAEYLGLDKLTVRVLLREGLVQWGTAVKLPGSSHYTYLIFKSKFESSTGINVGGDSENYE